MKADYSNHFLAMLGKLNRSNKIIFLALLLLVSCAEERFSHVEITCPGKPLMLVRYVTFDEVRASVLKGIDDKKKFKTSENYTVIYTSGNRSILIKVSPEEMLKCSFQVVAVRHPDKNMTKYTDY